LHQQQEYQQERKTISLPLKKLIIFIINSKLNMIAYSKLSIKILLLFLLCSFFEVRSNAQICTDLRDGVFYSYPKNTAKQYVITRQGEYQKEIDLVTGDTTLWKVSWLNDCTYCLTYISGSAKLTGEIKTLLESHKLVTKIESISGDFYTYFFYLDKAAGKYLLTDTIWSQKKSVVANNTLFEFVPANTSIKKLNFNRKSPYALLYVYRPAKFAGSKGEYILYFDGNIMCASKNGVAYIFKIFKEGDFKLSAKLFNQKEVTQNINIKFGQQIYLKAGLKFILTNASGWRPDLLIIDPEKGSDEFSEIEMP
jgi:hypothetical protein